MTAQGRGGQRLYCAVCGAETPVREVEYNDWYSTRHAPDVVSIPGFVSAQRYVASEHQLRPGAKLPVKQIIEFKIVGDDLAAVMPGKGGDVPNARNGPRTHYIQVVYATATPGKEKEFND